MEFIKPGMRKTRPQDPDKTATRLQHVRIQLRVAKEVPRGQVHQNYAASRFSASFLFEFFLHFGLCHRQAIPTSARAVPVRMRS